MSTSLLDRAEARTDTATTTTAAQRLRTTMAAVPGLVHLVRRPEDAHPRAEGAGRRGVRRRGPVPLAPTKKLIDTRHPAFRAVTAVRGKIDAFWKSQSLPFPEPGVRLIRQDKVEAFARQMDDYQVELDDAVANLDRHFGELKRAAARAARLALQRPTDYPETLRGLFAVAYDFPRVEPPDYLVALSPQLYEQERARVAARFEEAVRLAEEAFLAEFARLVAHLTERITGTNDDGTAKVFRDSAVGNLVEFFERFRQLNVRSQRAARRPGRPRRSGSSAGSSPQDLRDSDALRQRVASASCRGSSRRSTTCWSTGPGGGSSAAPSPREARDAARRRPGGPGPGRLLRGDRPGRARPPRDHPRQPRRARPRRPLASPTCRPSAGRCSARSTAAARPWRPSAPGSRRTGSCRAPDRRRRLDPLPSSPIPVVPHPPRSPSDPARRDPPGVRAAAGRGARPSPEESLHDPGPARPRRRRRHRRVAPDRPPPGLQPRRRDRRRPGARGPATWSSTARSAAGPSPYPGRPRDGSLPLAECLACDVYFAFDADEVYAAGDRPRLVGRPARSPTPGEVTAPTVDDPCRPPGPPDTIDPVDRDRDNPSPAAPRAAAPPRQGQPDHDHDHPPPGPPPARRLPPLRPGHRPPRAGPAAGAPRRGDATAGAISVRRPWPSSTSSRARTGPHEAIALPLDALADFEGRDDSPVVAGGRRARPDRRPLGRPRHPPDPRVRRPGARHAGAVPRAARVVGRGPGRAARRPGRGDRHRRRRQHAVRPGLHPAQGRRPARSSPPTAASSSSRAASPSPGRRRPGPALAGLRLQGAAPRPAGLGRQDRHPRRAPRRPLDPVPGDPDRRPLPPGRPGHPRRPGRGHPAAARRRGRRVPGPGARPAARGRRAEQPGDRSTSTAGSPSGPGRRTRPR